MFTKLKISNFKSITDLEIDLGRFNVFIGENGCGKTNILEAVALLSAAKSDQLDPVNLDSKGIRVTKPNLTSSSFNGINLKKTVDISLTGSENFNCKLSNKEKNNIYSNWTDLVEEEKKQFLNLIFKNFLYTKNGRQSLTNFTKEIVGEDTGLTQNDFKSIKNIDLSSISEIISKQIEPITSTLKDYLIYSINSSALRGLYILNKTTPLGIYGEGLDVLINNFTKTEKDKVHELLQIITWFNELIIDNDKTLKNEGHNLGRSTSNIYFTDKFMKRNNKTFAAENANEGILFLLFYFSLFISDKTPKFFAIDNIETALNPKLCRDLTKQLAILAKQNNKQALITTHNPAILDGLNLNDDDQRLFVVRRSDEGHTKVDRIKIKPNSKGMEGLKLSELWMRGYLGGLSIGRF